MTDLLAPPAPADAPPDRSRGPWVAALLAAGWSALAGLALCTAPVLLTWLASGAEPALAAPLRLGADLWLVAHHVPLRVPTAVLTLPPLGLLLPLAALVVGAGRWAAAASGVPDRASALRLVGALAGAYALIAVVVAGVAGSPDRAVDPRAAGLWAGSLALLAGAAGVASESAYGTAAWHRLPARYRTWVRAGAAGAAALVAGGGLLVAGSLLWHGGAVARLGESLGAGVVGGLTVTLLGAVLVPNAAVWGAAYAVGPGFAVGSGTTVSPAEVSVGPLPALPALAAVPASPDPLGWWVLVIPAAAGVVVALVLRQSLPASAETAPGPTRWTTRLAGAGDRVLDAVAAGTVAGLAMGLLAMLSGGSAGPGRLAEVGPTPLPVALLTAAELALVAAVVLVVPRPRRPTRQDEADVAGPAQDPSGGRGGRRGDAQADTSRAT